MSDVNYDKSPAMMAARGQTYGKRKQQIDAQRAVPMGRSPLEVQAQDVARPVPNAPGQFTAPSSRPMEPITAGSNIGAGPNAMQAGIPDEMSASDDALRELKAIYSAYPSQELADIIQFYEQSRM